MDDDADGGERRVRPSPRPRPTPPTESRSDNREPSVDSTVDVAAAPRPAEPDEGGEHGNHNDAADEDAGSRRRGWWRGRAASTEPPPTPRHSAPVGRAPGAASTAEDGGRQNDSDDTGERGADPADSAGSTGSRKSVDPSATDDAAPSSAPRPRPAPRVQASEAGPAAPTTQAPTAEPPSGGASSRAGTRSARPPSLDKFIEASEPQDGDDTKERRFGRKHKTETETGAEPAEAHPADAEPAEAHPADAEPAEAHPADAEPAEAHPADAEPADAHPADAEHAATGDAEPGKRRFGRKKREGQQSGGAEEKKAGPDSSDRRRNLVRRFARLAVVLVIILGAGIALRAYVVQPYYIPSESMEPTLHGCNHCDDDHILINKLSYTPQEQDIVVFKRPAGFATTDNVLVKRIVGLPGDTVSLKSGLLYVNGLPITEPYINTKCPGAAASTKPLVAGKSTWRIPSTDVFVMGDNRCNSADSRVFGPIPVSSIIGKVIAITWPFGRIGGVG